MSPYPGRGLGRQPGGFGLGPGGKCVCPVCGYSSSHGLGTPCNTISCPKCGGKLTRER